MGTIRRVDFSPTEFLEGVSTLSVAQIGLYWVACSLIYARGEPIANDEKWIGRAAGCGKPAYARKLLNQLIALGKLKLTVDGRLINGRAAEELAAASKRVSDGRLAAETRWHRQSRRREYRLPTGSSQASRATTGFVGNQPVNGHTRNANHQPSKNQTHDSESSVAAREAELSPAARPAHADKPDPLTPAAQAVRRATPPPDASGAAVGRPPDPADVERTIRELGVDPATVETPPAPRAKPAPSVRRQTSAEQLAALAAERRARLNGGGA